jgi:endo-1,4-beta-xylanase
MLRLTDALSARKSPRAFAVGMLILSLIASGLSLAPTPTAAQAGVLPQHDFEDGTLQGWIPRGAGVILTNTTEAAATGTRSLKTTNRTAGFHGPSLDLLNTLTPGTIYQVTASVRLVAGKPASNLKITVERVPSGGATAFDQVAPNTNVTDAAWVTLTGQYSFTTSNTRLLLYIESSDPTSEYFVDDFSIRVVPALGCADPPDTSGIHTNFESGTNEGWVPRFGGPTVAVTNADAHTGTFSLLTSNRNGAFNGPAINAAGKLCNGSRYRISFWVKLAPDVTATQTIRLSLERTLNGVTNFNTVISNTAIPINQWVQLRTTYDFVFNYQSLRLYVESNGGTASFYIDDFDVAFVPPPVAERDIPSVYQSLAEHFPIGAAVWQGDLTGEHAFLLTRHFNSLTSENDMKWGALQPTEGNFTFATADAQVNFGKANNMLIRGHTLVWHNQNPTWLFNDLNGQPMTPTPENRALLLQRLRNHIQTVITHYGDDIYAWDVVNEVIDPAQPDGFRRSQWFNILGTEYIDEAFRVARQVAPNAKLYINDFDTTNPIKRQFLLNLVSDLKDRGIPIDGVGHQMHNNIEFPSAQAIIDTINMFHDLGMDNQITELDVSIYSGSFPTAILDYADIPPDRFVRQGYRYSIFFQAFRQLQGKISSITFWGQADDHTWLTSAQRVNAPLLFDTSLKKKLAYWGVIDPLQLPGADLATSVSADASQVQAGQDVSYSIVVSNVGDNDVEPFLPTDDDLPATNVTMVSPLPAGTVFRSLTAPVEWTCTAPYPGTGGSVQCSIPTLAVDASGQFTVTVGTTCATPDATALVASANATSATADPNPAANNAASASVVVANSPPEMDLTDLTVLLPGIRIVLNGQTLTINGQTQTLTSQTVTILGQTITFNGSTITINGQTFTIDGQTIILLPPLGQYQTLSVADLVAGVSDNCDSDLGPGSVVIMQVTSDEVENAPGNSDGNTTNDIVIGADCKSVRLRVERSNNGNGRVYSVTLRVHDSAGNTTTKVARVTIPRGQGFGAAVEGSPQYVVTSACP